MQTPWYGSCFTESRTTHHHTVLTTFLQLLSLPDPGAKLMCEFLLTAPLCDPCCLPAAAHNTVHDTLSTVCLHRNQALCFRCACQWLLHTPHQQNDLCKITKRDRKHTNHTHTHTNKGSMQIQRYSAAAKHKSKQGPKHIVLIWLSNNKKHN